MNKITPKKLLNSKWTAVSPQNREKHFLITKVEFDEHDSITSTTLEAVISKREVSIQWQDLKDSGRWLQGWK